MAVKIVMVVGSMIIIVSEMPSDNRCVDKSLPMSIIHGENDALTFDTHDFGGEYVQGLTAMF